MRNIVIAILVAVVVCSCGSADVVRRVSLTTNDMVYDNHTASIYASVPSSAGVNGNSLARINPSTGNVSSYTFLGSEPAKLAISDDHQYIYAALSGAAAVRRFHVPTQTSGLQFSLGSDTWNGPFYVEDMEVLPGSPGSVAVSRRNIGFSPRHEGVAIYDNGVQRPTTTSDHTGSNVIEFSGSASTLYGYNNESTEYGFRTMTVGENGVTVDNVTRSLIQGFSYDIEYDGGRIYSTSGRVIDPVARMLLGSYSASGLVRPDHTTNRTFFLTGSGSTYTLKSFRMDTFVSLGSLEITGVSGTPSSLIRWGSNGLAFRTSSNQLFLIETDLVPVPEPASALALISLIAGTALPIVRRRRR